MSSYIGIVFIPNSFLYSRSKPNNEIPKKVIINLLKVLVAKTLFPIKIVGSADSFGMLNNIIVSTCIPVHTFYHAFPEIFTTTPFGLISPSKNSIFFTATILLNKIGEGAIK